MTDDQWLRLVEVQADVLNGLSALLNQVTGNFALKLEAFSGRLDAIMAATQDIQDAIGALNQETDNIAARIMALEAQIQGGVTPEDATVITGQLRSIAGRLRQLAAVEGNPVPGGAIAPSVPLPVM